MARGNNFIRFLRGKESSLTRKRLPGIARLRGRKQTLGKYRSGFALVPCRRMDWCAGSEKYLLGLEAAKRVLPSFRTDLIGFDQGAEVQLGQYQYRQGDIHIGVHQLPHAANRASPLWIAYGSS